MRHDAPRRPVFVVRAGRRRNAFWTVTDLGRQAIADNADDEDRAPTEPQAD